MKKIFIIFAFFLLTLGVFADEPKILPSVTGVVKSIEYENPDNDLSQAKQIVQIKLLEGENRGDVVVTENLITGNPYYDINLKNGTRVIMHVEDNGMGAEYSVQDIKRSGTLVWLSLIFCGLLVYVGKKKGLYSLVSIGLTVLMITNFLSPMILFGINPVFATVIICVLSTAVTMFLVGGFNAKSTSALVGTVLSLFFAAILAFLTILSASLTGFSGENSLFLFTAHPELDFVSLTISMIVIATLGAVMDVAMSISSTINEIYETDNTLCVKDLFVSGMNVGRDIIGTMANTLILVYLGGSLPLLLLAGNIDLQKFINLNQVVTEIASALIGSISIVICVPFTALAASGLIHKYAKLREENYEPKFNK